MNSAKSIAFANEGNDLSMDPFRALGLARDCTRDQVRAAFLARVPSTHPDRGGEDADFVELRAAYERILAILERREGRKSAGNGPQRPKDADGEVKAPEARRETRTSSDTAHSARVRLRLEKDRVKRLPGSAYVNWLSRVSADAERRDPRRRGKWARRLGASFILLGISWLAIGMLCSAGYAIYEAGQKPPRYVERPRYKEQSSKPEDEISSWEVVATVAVVLAPLSIILPIVCKYDDY